MQGLIGKKLAVVPDARLDNRANRSVITEKLLSIIGEDVQEINRKNKPFWSGILRLRVMILSNELPDFKDDTGVIATRFVILQTLVSFLGREDTELEGKLCGELSGILNWALVGWQRLAERGKFARPATANLMRNFRATLAWSKHSLLSVASLAPEFTVVIDTAYNAYRVWCEGAGAQVGLIGCRSINSPASSVPPSTDRSTRSAHGPAGRRKRMFKGIRLRKGGPHESRRVCGLVVRMKTAWSACTSSALTPYIYI